MKSMKNKILFFLLLLGSVFLTACSDEDNTTQSEIKIITTEEQLILDSKTNARITIDFTSTHDWKASTDASWAVITPTSGKAGTASIGILAKEENRTGEVRTGLLTLSCGEATAQVTFTQAAMDVLNIEQTVYDLSADEQEISIKFATNIQNGKITLKAEDNYSWITPKENTLTRAIEEGEIILKIQANERRSARNAKLKVQVVNINDENQILMESATININQKEAPVGTSSDLTTQDKKVILIQEHTEGNGIPLIFLGDGFLDTDISNGYYRQAMEKGIENFFTEEPIKSLRSYFDIWMVTAVSLNNAFGNQFNTKFSCRLEGGGSTLIEGNHSKVQEYAMEVPTLKENPELFNEATCIVILNTEEYAGTCYFGFNDGVKTINLAIGYCPMIYGMEDDMFRRVLCHECIGHGFSKLMDEYSYQEMGRIPTSEITDTQKMQEMGWAANVDFTNDRNAVLWSKFLKDSRYQGKDNYGETLGIYEGACTYWSGAYRPTTESMMRSNMHGFNAPSREAIYKRVMSTAYGKEWEYNYEEFVAFDQAHLPMPTEATTRATYKEATRPFSLPVFTNMTIRFAY